VTDFFVKKFNVEMTPQKKLNIIVRPKKDVLLGVLNKKYGTFIFPG